MKRIRGFLFSNTFLSLCGVFLLTYLLMWRLWFALFRYFDADELAHLHWGHNYFSGQMPYSDFFYIFPPFFLFLLSGVWSIFQDTLTVVIEARVLMFVFFLILLATVFLLGRLMRNTSVSLLSIILLSFLPIPYDKFLEVRPDLLATLLVFFGMYLLILAITSLDNRKKSIPLLFISAIFYGLSVGVVPKTLFFIPPVFIGFVFWVFSHKVPWKQVVNPIGIWTVGFLIPLTFIFIFSLVSGEPFYALSLMSKVASDASLELVTIYNHSFYMFPTHFFWPNQTLYGEGGMNFQYYVNLLIWVTGSIFAIIRFVGFLAKDTFQKQLTTLLLTSTFLLNLYGFVYVFPLKHSQYLIPLSVFVCIFFADFIVSIREYLQARSKRVTLVCSFLFLLLIFTAAEKTNRPKISWINTQDMNIFWKIEESIPDGSYVFDLSGYALKYKDPYYYCCVPYGQYWRVLPKKPSLSESLSRTDTQYVVNTRLDTLSDVDRAYIDDAFTTPLLEGMILSK